MNALEKNIAVARGEALAAHLLATAAIQASLAITSSREEVLAGMSAFIDETLNMSSHAPFFETRDWCSLSLSCPAGRAEVLFSAAAILSSAGINL